MNAVPAVCLAAAAALAASFAPARADCTCRAFGRSFQHGEVACIRGPSGPILMRCGKVLNNSAWLKVRDGCPQALSDDTAGTHGRRAAEAGDPVPARGPAVARL